LAERGNSLGSRTIASASLLAISLAACRVVPGGGLGGGGGDLPLRPEEARAGRAAAPGIARDGERVYRDYCAGCHGDKGDGQGPASRFLNPRPRDFTRGLFKFAGVPSGELPRDEDLMRTLSRGLPGSSMPSWALLPEQDRRAVIAYIKTLSRAWRRPPGPAVAISEDPFQRGGADAERKAVERGRVVYHVFATCWQCHPAYASRQEVARMAAAEGKEVEMRDDADVPVPVEDAWGEEVKAADFTSRRMKSGTAPLDFYRTIASGIGGTAMPTWKGGLEERDLWALAYYVKSLADRRWRRSGGVPSVEPPVAPAAPRTGR